MTPMRLPSPYEIIPSRKTPQTAGTTTAKAGHFGFGLIATLPGSARK